MISRPTDRARGRGWARWWRRAREPAQATVAWAGFVGGVFIAGWVTGGAGLPREACAAPAGWHADVVSGAIPRVTPAPRPPRGRSPSPGGLREPVVSIAMPVQGAILSSGFTTRRDHPLLHIARPHWGSDYAAPVGTPVHAAAEGVVTAALRSSTYGLVVEVSHWGGRLVTRYAHLSAVLVRPGQHVSQSEVIGRVGASGLASGPHLHFEIFVGGRRRDPALLLGPAHMAPQGP